MKKPEPIKGEISRNFPYGAYILTSDQVKLNEIISYFSHREEKMVKAIKFLAACMKMDIGDGNFEYFNSILKEEE